MRGTLSYSSLTMVSGLRDLTLTMRSMEWGLVSIRVSRGWFSSRVTWKWKVDSEREKRRDDLSYSLWPRVISCKCAPTKTLKNEKVLKNDWSIIKQLLLPLFCCNLPQMMSHFYEHLLWNIFYNPYNVIYVFHEYFNWRMFTFCSVLLLTRVSLLSSWPSPWLSSDSDIETDNLIRRRTVTVSRALIVILWVQAISIHY